MSDFSSRPFGGPRGRGGPRRDRRDDRRRTNDDEDTILDSQEVSSVDRGKFIRENVSGNKFIVSST